MSKRKQRRVKAILPLKITLTGEGQRYLGHTVEISASGARTILPVGLEPGSVLVLECKHRRCRAVVVWSRAVEGCKSSHEHGLRLLNRELAFWMINLALQEEDTDFSVAADMDSKRVWSQVKAAKY